MDFRTRVAQLERTKEFRDFKARNEDYYLVNVFYNVSEGREDLSVGYYSKSKDRIITFSTNPVKASSEQEVFKPDGTVSRLDMEGVKIRYDKAKKLADLVMKENYAGERVTKTMCILQVLGQTVYNFTLVSASFHIINLRIDAGTGRLVTKSRQSIMDLGQKIK
ncbi:hypothetical protein JW868_04740 [Candidatus Woesearchaeota archaeon]|nr:hypothetical protein [Candidatus Woesearchaeota archaeon]